MNTFYKGDSHMNQSTYCIDLSKALDGFLKYKTTEVLNQLTK
jgi:hypothetical protein